LAREAVDFVTPRVRASFPEVVDAIRGLYADGYVMHTASGNRSFELERYLRGLDIRECFAAGPLYGCDVVGMPKVGPEFYVRVFEHTGVRPNDALVVDDSPLAVGWAAEVGAEALLVSRSPSAASDVPSLTMPSDRRSPVAALPSLAAVRERLAVKDA
jgi:FMN phosphatase YigB (HAD superfamily)